MATELHFTSLLWAYLYAIPSLGGKIPPGGFRGHKLAKKGGNVVPGCSSSYGQMRPWVMREECEPEELLAARHWESARNEDYYVQPSESTAGPMCGKGFQVSHFYPERLFLFGKDEKGEPLLRHQLLEHAAALGLRCGASFWDPVIRWTGYREGLPVFQDGLRAETQMGSTMSDLQHRLASLPPGYEHYKSAGDPVLTVYYEP